MEQKHQFCLDNIKECQFSVTLHWLLFKITSTILYAQLCTSQR